ncbi:transmembrane anchor protein [Parendozoicomonas haliclonae]|uniref:Transmembrane anchor protein n=1 Tax=Parendozoicomonas haliclonae TaxID=1960125 RepID=A0A1X7AHX8_9GAMM|nr:transmembrane anchor protein [Parendozoicomonas haliclonae]SMA42734.1 hypothetical protein EHSB41UT_01480 [Parendozoicomonas haliclonae]
MYNADKPTRDELPSSLQLLRSTVIALVVAIVVLVTVILPSEYAIDPTGAGRILGLTEMGEIKEQLAEEAAADRAATQQVQKEVSAPAKPEQVAEVVSAPAVIEPPKVITVVEPAVVWRDEVRIPLTPGQGAEIKLVMKEGEVATFTWNAIGGPVNYDTHGDGSGRSISYEKGRGVPQDEGELEAAFKGNHGWFFRNRNKQDVTVVLKTGGEYSAMKRVL